MGNLKPNFLKKIALLLPLVIVAQFFAQQGIKVTYKDWDAQAGKYKTDPVLVFADVNKTRIVLQSELEKKKPYPWQETFIDRTENSAMFVLHIRENYAVGTKDKKGLPRQATQFTKTDETRMILGYKCTKSQATFNGNVVDFWHTNDLGIAGSPNILGQNLGLVLLISAKGVDDLVATKVEKMDVKSYLEFPPGMHEVDAFGYQKALGELNITRFDIFKDQIIQYTGKPVSDDQILRFAGGTLILKKVTFPVIKENTLIFAELIERSVGDDYDRTGSVFIIPEDRETTFFDGLKNGVNTLPIYENGNGKKYQGVALTENYVPVLELIRFMTPFGIGHFNDKVPQKLKWHQQVSYRQEISDLYPSLSEKSVWVGVFISTWNGHGHKIDLNISLHKQGLPVANNFVLPLFNTTNVLEMGGQQYGTMFDNSKGMEVQFNLKKDVKSAQLRYTTTGHGGWGGGDEFNPKRNTIFIDGKEVFSFLPWRDDCASYRLYNPASGDFGNGVTSSDLSRSNWCPATLTSPEYIDLGDLKAGDHTIKVTIKQGASQDKQFSWWCTSGALIGNVEIEKPEDKKEESPISTQSSGGEATETIAHYTLGVLTISREVNHVKIHTADGRLVYDKAQEKPTKIWDVPHLSPGAYVLGVTKDNTNEHIIFSAN